MKKLILISLIFCLSSYASEEFLHYWKSGLGLVEKHEFYRPFEEIKKPLETWQILFAVKYPTQNLKIVKDCVFYYVPKKDEGILKIKTIELDEKCENFLFQKGDYEFDSIRSLQYSVDKKIQVLITYSDFSIKKWGIELNQTEGQKKSSLLQSSSLRKIGSPYLFLVKKDLSFKPSPVKAKNVICHHIDDECREITPSDCNACDMGWYEVPNGCPVSPKYCGIQICGVKNGPACLKGRVDIANKLLERFDCKKDEDYFYCSKGLTLQCQGSLAFCR